jgi:predicted amidohydrolase YtcJ
MSLVLSLLLVAFAQEEPAPYADTVLYNGNIVTLDEDRPRADALAIRGGRIQALGTKAELDPLIGRDTRVHDLDGGTAIPGFIEGHGHFLGIGERRMQLDLRRVASWDEVVALVAAAAKEAPPGHLLRGRGWHQDKWDRVPEPNVDGLPLHAALSAVSPDHPVLLRHASGHATYANARAMELAGVTRDTPDPAGGEIVRDADGEPIGVFRETAAGLFGPVYASAIAPDPRRVASLANAEVLSKGITTFHDAGSSFATVDLYRELLRSGQMRVRMWVMLNESNAALAERMDEYRLIGAEDGRLTVRAIKRSIDGALGSHGAWLLEPYTDLPTSSGLNTTSLESVAETAKLARDHRFQLCVHAIGDRGNREMLDLFQRTCGNMGPGLRWRIEHAQHLHPDDIPRFGKLGVIASMQGIHCTSDAVFVPDRLGDARAESGAYVWRSLIDSGAIVTNGTDAPVEDVDPLACYHATVTRRLADGSTFYPDQRQTRLQALRSYTLNNAYAAFEETEKGSLEPGKLADITVLSRDILTAPADELLETEVMATIIGGEFVFRNRGGGRPR